jgi:Leucine rich repeat
VGHEGYSLDGVKSMFELTKTLTLLLLIVTTSHGCEIGQDEDPYPTPKSCAEPNPLYSVRFGDPVLERQIIDKLGLADRHPSHEELCRLYLIDFGDCEITGLSGLQFATNLRTVNLRFNDIEDVGPLSVLPEIKSLKLSYNRIGDISSLRNLEALQEFDLDNNQVVNIEALIGMDSLARVNLSNNLIEEIRPLLFCPGLRTGGFVDLTGNPLSEESIDVYIPELRMREVTVAY